MTADAAKLKAAGVAPYMLANQQQWEAQFPFSAYFVNRYGLATYKGLIDRKIPWSDPRVVEALNAMAKDVKNGEYLQPINGMDFDTTAIIFWKRQQAAMWYQGSFILSKFLNKGKLAYPVDWVPYPQDRQHEAVGLGLCREHVHAQQEEQEQGRRRQVPRLRRLQGGSDEDARARWPVRGKPLGAPAGLVACTRAEGWLP